MTATSAAPAVIDAIIAAVRDAEPTGVTVYDGIGVTDDPGNYLMVGVDDPDAKRHTTAASSEQNWAHANRGARDETGDISCAALAWNGDGDQKAARDAAYAITAVVEIVLRATPNLGLENVLWLSFGTASDLSQAQTSSGAVATVTFTLHYKARL